MTQAQQPLSAAVLAGGKSSRMGQDKALLPLIEGGQSLLAIVLDRLAELSDDVMIVANDESRYGHLGHRIVSDRVHGVGTLGGIHAAISEAQYEHTLVVACDMPFLSRRLLQCMAREPRDFDVLAPLIPGESRQRGDGFVFQTLHAIYSKRCIRAIEEEIARGNRQVIGFYAHVRVRAIDQTKVRQADPEFRSFFNANTPETLAEARELMRHEEPV